MGIPASSAAHDGDDEPGVGPPSGCVRSLAKHFHRRANSQVISCFAAFSPLRTLLTRDLQLHRRPRYHVRHNVGYVLALAAPVRVGCRPLPRLLRRHDHSIRRHLVVRPGDRRLFLPRHNVRRATCGCAAAVTCALRARRYNFRLAYRDSRGVRQSNPSDIAKNYVTGWFLLDFVACLPVNHIAAAVNTEGKDDGQFNTKFIKVLRLLRLSKLLRLARIKRMLEKYSNSYVLQQYLAVFMLLIIIVFTTHFLTCFWFLVGAFQLSIHRRAHAARCTLSD